MAYINGKEILFSPIISPTINKNILPSVIDKTVTSITEEDIGRPTTIPTYFFHCCENLSSIEIPDSVTTICTGAFGKCKLTSVEIPSSVETIEVDAFNACRSLTSVKLNSGLIRLGGFANCERLGNITIPDTVKTIGEKAFLQCYYNLTSIDIPKSVYTIQNRAFQRCTNLTTVKVYRDPFYFDILPSLGTQVFDGCSSLTEIRVPALLLDKFKSATNWSAYADIMVGY